MNERTTPPAPAKAEPQKPQPYVSPVQGRDREFLPAALEILETPPSPLPVVSMLTICAVFAAAITWSWFGKLDVHAVAPGKIETAGRAKTIQPFDNGKVAAIDVANGQAVKAGEVLLELDPAEAAADADAARDARSESLAETARRSYEADVAKRLIERGDDDGRARGFERLAIADAEAKAETAVGFADEVPANIRLRQRSVLNADLESLADQLSALDKQIAQKEATHQRLDMSMAFQDELMKTLNDRVKTRQDAITLKVGTKINLYDAKEELQKSQSQLASDQGEAIETEAALDELKAEKIKTIGQFVSDNENKGVDAARKAEDAKQTLAKAMSKLGRTRLVAPIDGVVQQLSVTTIGQVVTTGQQLMVITPNRGRLQVDVLVANLDIGFVKLGQDAVIKVDAFPFTRFGALKGKVVRIAQEAVNETEAKRALANVTSPGNAAPAQTSAPGQPESFVFPVVIELSDSTMRIADVDMPLNPGMTVSAEIKTDSRRVIDYLLSPLAKVGSEAMRER